MLLLGYGFIHPCRPPKQTCYTTSEPPGTEIMLTRNNARSLTNASIHRFKPSSMVTCKAYNNCTVCVHAYKAPPRTCSHSHTNTLTHAHTLRARRFLMEVGHLGDPKLVTFRTKGGPKCQTRFRSDPLCQCCCEFIRSNCGKRDTLSSERSNYGASGASPTGRCSDGRADGHDGTSITLLVFSCLFCF